MMCRCSPSLGGGGWRGAAGAGCGWLGGCRGGVEDCGGQKRREADDRASGGSLLLDRRSPGTGSGRLGWGGRGNGSSLLNLRRCGLWGGLRTWSGLIWNDRAEGRRTAPVAFRSVSGRVSQDDARALGVDGGSALAAFRSLRSVTGSWTGSTVARSRPPGPTLPETSLCDLGPCCSEKFLVSTTRPPVSLPSWNGLRGHAVLDRQHRRGGKRPRRFRRYAAAPGGSQVEKQK